MNNKTYSEKLRDPRWQRKRLEILELYKWECNSCYCNDKELHVHHKTYVYGRDPWDYPNANFEALCSQCHEIEEMYKEDFKSLVEFLLTNYYLNYQSLYNKLKEAFNVPEINKPYAESSNPGLD